MSLAINAKSNKRQKASHDRSVSNRDVAAGISIEGNTNDTARPLPSEILRSTETTSHAYNTFGLEEQAVKWLHDELQRSKDSYLREGPQYIPFTCSKNGKVPPKHFQKAFLEFDKHFGKSTSRDKSPSVLLVATGV